MKTHIAKIIIGLLLVMSLLLFCSDEKEYTYKIPYVKTELRASGPCPYSGESFYYDFGAIPDSLDTEQNCALAECETRCKYDNKRFRKALIDIINGKIHFGNRTCKNSKNYLKEGICLSAYYEFPDSPDFVLLKYFYLPIGPIFIGYVKSQKELYILNDIRFESLKKNYNLMLKSNPGILNIDPLCRAAMIVALIYRRGTTVILDSIQDILPAMAIERGNHGEKIHSPFDPWGNDLYIFSILKYGGVQEYTEYIDSIYDQKFYLTEVLRKIAERNLTIFSPEVYEFDSNTVVELACFNSWSMEGQLAWWRFEFDDDGRLLSRQCVDTLTAWKYFNP